MKKVYSLVLLVLSFGVNAQKGYWQQHIDYKMDIDVDVKSYQFTGHQEITYKNNSGDELTNVFYHLYLNAFQPGSEMDTRLQTIKDPDRRMVLNHGTKKEPIYESRISKLPENEQGYLKIIDLKQDGQPVKFEVIGTILKVTLNKPIKPGKKAKFVMNFKGQAPTMVRRTGRLNPDGVEFSMTQWYPKMCEYDTSGWHANQYVFREFHGVWGNFDVKISIDKDYIVAGTGELKNAKEIGFGYLPNTPGGVQTSSQKRTWHFVGKNIHDFTWAADPNFKHDIKTSKDGKQIHFFYKTEHENWQKMEPVMVRVFDFYSEKVGQYPWNTYSFIQGGDGGMEYAMCTLIVGGKNYDSLLTTAVHELGHTWFQNILASDELTYPWVDEGFTSYIEYWAMGEIVRGDSPQKNHWIEAYQDYQYLVDSGLQEVATTHADRYNTNLAYSINAYSKGNIFLSQLGYIIGRDNLDKTIKRYFIDYGMKHPKPIDFIRTAEKVSNMQLYWYLNEFMETNHEVDYSIDSVEPQGNSTKVTIRRNGKMPMPVDIQVNGGIKYNIPTVLTLGNRPTKPGEKVLNYWLWAQPTYTFTIDMPMSQISKIEIDPDNYTTDIKREDNIYPKK